MSPWVAQDIGGPVVPGGARKDGDCLLAGGGGAILSPASGAADRFHFVHRELTGDGVLTARVSWIDRKRTGQVGLMLREGLEPGARYMAVAVHSDRNDVICTTLRRFQADAEAQVALGPRHAAGEVWIQLERQGTNFTTRLSADGKSWTALRTLGLTRADLALRGGLFAAGDDAAGALMTGRACVRISGGEVEGLAPFRRGDVRADGILDVTDPVNVLGFLFLGSPSSLGCPASADADRNGALELTDAVYLLSFLFLGGPAPGDPFPDCGPDPGSGFLTCKDHPPCR
ncbi:MAG: DUF1349 domain-containing protein [Thermoanaerobaculia bacterium]